MFSKKKIIFFTKYDEFYKKSLNSPQYLYLALQKTRFKPYFIKSLNNGN